MQRSMLHAAVVEIDLTVLREGVGNFVNALVSRNPRVSANVVPRDRAFSARLHQVRELLPQPARSIAKISERMSERRAPFVPRKTGDSTCQVPGVPGGARGAPNLHNLPGVPGVAPNLHNLSNRLDELSRSWRSQVA